MITQCVVSRLYTEGAASQEATDLAKTFERRKCNHWQVKETDGECITGIIGNDNRYRYCVASQSPATRGQLRRVPGVPIFFETRGMVLLEPPSDASVNHRKRVSLFFSSRYILCSDPVFDPRQLEESKLHMPKEEVAMLKPKASTSRLPPTANSSNVIGALPQEGQAQTPASGVDAVADLPAATRSTSASKPNTIEQKLTRAHASSKKRKMKEPNPLSIRKKKPNMTMPKKNASSSSSSAAATTKAAGEPQQSGTTDQGAVDPTKGVSRKQGDGLSKKALKRKQKKAEKQGDGKSEGASTTAAVTDMQVDAPAA